MAGRGLKLKDYRVPISSVKQWNAEIAFPHLSVVEIFSSSFGPCQVILPTINTIMMNIENSESRVKWLQVNISKLEEEQRVMKAEEEKKNEELEGNKSKVSNIILQHSAAGVLPSADTMLFSPLEHKEEKEQVGAHGIDSDEDGAAIRETSSAYQRARRQSVVEGAGVNSLPKLSAFSGYDHPRPLWLFFVNGVLHYELTSANPPKMTRLVQACLNGSHLSEAELSSMELQADSLEVSEEKKKKRKMKKQQEEEARKKQKDKEAEEAKKTNRQKKEIIRSPEYLLHLSLNQVKDGEETFAEKQAVLVFSIRDSDSDDYRYHSQTSRAAVKPDGTVTFSNPLAVKKAEGRDSQASLEVKFALYARDNDEQLKGVGADDSTGFLGDGYASFGSVIRNEVKELKLAIRDKAAPLSPPITARTPRGTAREKVSAVLKIAVKERLSEGVLTDYRINVQLHNTQNNVESAEAYAVALSIMDDTLTAPIVAGQTETANASFPVSFSTPLAVTHYSRVERQLTFTVTKENGQSEAQVSSTFSSLINTASPVIQQVTPSLQLHLTIYEVDDKGDSIAGAAAGLSKQEKERLANQEYVEAIVSVKGLQSISTHATISVYQPNAKSGQMMLVAQTEGVDVSGDDVLRFNSALLLEKPNEDQSSPAFKLVIHDSQDSSLILGQSLLDLSTILSDDTTTPITVELAAETVEGVSVANTVITASFLVLGRKVDWPLSFSSADLPTLERPGHESVNPLLLAFSASRQGRRTTAILGQTEWIQGNANPVFQTLITVPYYTKNWDNKLVFRVFDASAADAVPTDSEFIGEAIIGLEEIRWQTTNTLQVKLLKEGKESQGTLTVTNNAAQVKPIEEVSVPTEPAATSSSSRVSSPVRTNRSPGSVTRPTKPAASRAVNTAAVPAVPVPTASPTSTSSRSTRSTKTSARSTTNGRPSSGAGNKPASRTKVGSTTTAAAAAAANASPKNKTTPSNRSPATSARAASNSFYQTGAAASPAAKRSSRASKVEGSASNTETASAMKASPRDNPVEATTATKQEAPVSARAGDTLVVPSAEVAMNEPVATSTGQEQVQPPAQSASETAALLCKDANAKPADDEYADDTETGVAGVAAVAADAAPTATNEGGETSTDKETLSVPAPKPAADTPSTAVPAAATADATPA